ncbi:glycoside hydrolase family 43 protein [Cadophora sp. DSE1049]|nr:glycoside hydrolase family 43 protein [Cadophora sp. DSE1049]
MALTEFSNPIIPGFAPDPSLVLVDGVYFLVNSSFHVFPGLPIYASRDLQNWEQIEIVLTKATTLGFPIGRHRTLFATLGLVAPTIRWHKGTFYVVCTNLSHAPEGMAFSYRNFYVTTTDIWSCKWSKPIYFEFTGIDTSIFFEDDDRAYIQGSWRESMTSCDIRQFEVDILTGQPLSATKEIWKGYAGKNDAEGPHIYKKDGYYYLLTAECGTFEDHAIGIARSKSIWGPYESYEQNPILTAAGKNEYVKNTGHGDLFQDDCGAWWLVCLGVRNEEGRYPLGRETFLTPVSWPSSEWPFVEHPKITFKRESVTNPSSKSLPSAPGQAQADFLYIRNVRLEDYKISANGRDISIVPSSTTLSAQSGTFSFIGKRQRSITSSASATLLQDQIATGVPVQAGLALYKDDMRHSEIYYDHLLSAVCLNKETKLNGSATTKQQSVTPKKKIEFRIVGKPKLYCFEYKVDDAPQWVSIGELDSLAITGLDFTGPILGIFSTVPDTDVYAPVQFVDFSVNI